MHVMYLTDSAPIDTFPVERITVQESELPGCHKEVVFRSTLGIRKLYMDHASYKELQIQLIGGTTQ